jgi:hypothetical protein
MQKQIEDLRRRMAEFEREMKGVKTDVTDRILRQQEVDHGVRMATIMGTFRQDLRKAEERLRQT